MAANSTKVYPSNSIYINLVPGYSALPCCAQMPVSVAVRDMSNGCGDGGALTSYNCFCSSSSTFFNSLIASEASADCGNAADASSAVDVFSSYCAIGVSGTQTRASTTSTAGASVCAKPTSTSKTGAQPLPTTTPTATATSPPPAQTSSAATGLRVKDLLMLSVTCVLTLGLVM